VFTQSRRAIIRVPIVNEQAVMRATPCFVALSFGIVYGQIATTVITRN